MVDNGNDSTAVPTMALALAFCNAPFSDMPDQRLSSSKPRTAVSWDTLRKFRGRPKRRRLHNHHLHRRLDDMPAPVKPFCLRYIPRGDAMNAFLTKNENKTLGTAMMAPVFLGRFKKKEQQLQHLHVPAQRGPHAGFSSMTMVAFCRRLDGPCFDIVQAS